MIKVTSFIEEPLVSIMKKYGFPSEGGETYELDIEYENQEGDLFLPDFISEEYEEDIKELNLKNSLLSFDTTVENWKDIPDEIFKDNVIAKGIDYDAIDNVVGWMLFNTDFNELYFLGYLVYANNEQYSICFKAE